MQKSSLGLQDYVLLSVPFVAIFALIPFELYFTGREHWSLPRHGLVAIAGWGLAAYLAGCVLLHLVAAYRRAGVAAGLARGLFCLGLFVLLADLYVPLQATPLDGSKLRATESALHIAIEAALFLLAVALFVAMTRKQTARTIAAVFSALLLLTAAGYAAVIALAGEDAGDEVVAGTAPPADLGGNVYHILLDRMQTDVFLHVLEQKKTEFLDAFDGFDLFRNNVSNYLSTHLSLPSYFTGTLARTGDLKAWSGSWKERGLLPGLADAGYRTTIYAPREGWGSGYASRFVLAKEVYQRRTGVYDSGLQEFTFIWLVRLAPAFLTEEIVGRSGAFQRTFFPAAGRGVPVTREEGLFPFTGSLLMREMINDERRRAPVGEYVYMHAVLPHIPYVLDGNCDYRGRVAAVPRSREWDAAHLLQTECALRLVTAFFEELKRLDRFDRSLIIVHADTGSGDGFVSLRQGVTGAELRARRKQRAMDVQNALGWSNEDLIGRALALLMVKRPGAEGPLRISDAPTQLVDLYPTIVDVLALDGPDYPMEGRSVYGIAEGERRDIRIAFDPSELYGKRLMEVRIESPDDLFHSALTLMGPAAEMAGATGGGGRRTELTRRQSPGPP